MSPNFVVFLLGDPCFSHMFSRVILSLKFDDLKLVNPSMLMGMKNHNPKKPLRNQRYSKREKTPPVNALGASNSLAFLLRQRFFQWMKALRHEGHETARHGLTHAFSLLGYHLECRING